MSTFEQSIPIEDNEDRKKQRKQVRVYKRESRLQNWLDDNYKQKGSIQEPAPQLTSLLAGTYRSANIANAEFRSERKGLRKLHHKTLSTARDRALFAET